MIIDQDYARARELFRQTFGAELGTTAGADAIGMPPDQPNRDYWRAQLEWCVNRDASPWAYNLVYQRSVAAGW